LNALSLKDVFYSQNVMFTMWCIIWLAFACLDWSNQSDSCSTSSLFICSVGRSPLITWGKLLADPCPVCLIQ
jgi:hypothetical protein